MIYRSNIHSFKTYIKDDCRIIRNGIHYRRDKLTGSWIFVLKFWNRAVYIRKFDSNINNCVLFYKLKKIKTPDWLLHHTGHNWMQIPYME